MVTNDRVFSRKLCRAIVKGHRKTYNISIGRHWGTAERKKLTYET